MQRQGVIASGGGIIKRKENRQLLQDKARTVYLYCSVAQQYQRTLHDTNRPMIKQDDALKSLTELFAVRDPLYREVASFIVDTGTQEVAACIAVIAEALQEGRL